MDQDADDWLAALLEYYGDEKGKQIARSLGAQSLHIRKGRTLVSQLVAAGEFPLQIDAHHHEATALRKAGAPIDYVFPEPFIPVKSVSSLVMASQPPHPHAAAPGRLHDFEKRPRDRLQTTTLARVERSRHGRPGRCRQPQHSRARCREMGQQIRRAGAVDQGVRKLMNTATAGRWLI